MIEFHLPFFFFFSFFFPRGMIAKSSLDKDMKYLLTEMDNLIGILKVFSPLKGMFLADLKAFRSRETKTR